MKKTIFAIVIISIFALNGLALAKTPSSNTSSEEDMWFAINDLRNQVASLQAELGQSQDGSPKTKADKADSKKSTEEKVIVVDEGDDDISRSEHYIMKGFSIP